jgi:hypothetical protein
MLLTKTTSAVLIPSVFWLAWSAMGRKAAAFLRVALAVAVVPAALTRGYAVLVSAMGYGADYKYFFSRNALDDFDWSQSLNTLIELARNCLLVDRVLCPVALVILVLALVWKRKLWSNALFYRVVARTCGPGVFYLSPAGRLRTALFPRDACAGDLIAALTLDEVLAHSKTTPIPPNPEAACRRRSRHRKAGIRTKLPQDRTRSGIPVQ